MGGEEPIKDGGGCWACLDPILNQSYAREKHFLN